MNDAPNVLIMARVPRRGQVRRALEQVIGLDGCLALQAALLVEAATWARTIGARVYCAYEPADAGGELRALLGDEVALFPQNGAGMARRVADAAGRVFSHGDGPLLVVWPEIPHLRPAHAGGALADLEDGADVVLGPLNDGGFYLVGLSRAVPVLFGLPEHFWRGADGIALAFGAAAEASLEVGLLRAERGLHKAADVQAALVDPTLPATVARALGRR